MLKVQDWLDEHPVVLPNGAAVGFRTGVHSGLALVGNFGASSRWDYTAIGDVVNTAARLEPLNKQLGTSCLASGVVRAEATPPLLDRFRPLGSVQLVGKQQVTEVYEISSAPFPEPDAWAQAIDHFQNRRFAEAAAYFSTRTGDLAAQALLQEITEAGACEGQGKYVRAMKSK